MNYLLMQIEIQTLDGKVYKQPNCRIKTTAEGNVMLLVKNEKGRWHGVKGKLYIKNLKLRKEFYISEDKDKIRVPYWLIKLFGVKL